MHVVVRGPAQSTISGVVIYGTSYSPQKAFVDFASGLPEHVARGEVSAALSGLDANEDGSRWTKQRLIAALNAAVAPGRSVRRLATVGLRCHSLRRLMTAKPTSYRIVF